MKIATFLFLIITFLSCRSSKSSISREEGNVGKENVLTLLPKANNPRNSEGDFITLKDGRILYVYSHYTGTSDSDHAHAYLAGRYSSDQGKTWTQEDVKIVEQEGTMNVMSVSLLRLQNGAIALFYLKKNSETDCIPFIRISDDETKTWSDPQPCITNKPGYFVLNNNRVIQLKNGRLLLSVAMHRSPGQLFSNMGRIYSYFSDDNGKSWKSSQEVPNPAAIVTQEPGMVELRNGSILMFMRTMSGIQYLSYSKDEGKTWSTVEASNIKSPCSPASITRIPSTGDLLLVWNDNGIDQKRTPFNIAISKDEGKTWINNKILENNSTGVYCYPAIHFINQDVLIGYLDASVMGSFVLRLKLDWINK
ncbi:MAG: sialidase family protein [Ginsengibacter sp.]